MTKEVLAKEKWRSFHEFWDTNSMDSSNVDSYAIDVESVNLKTMKFNESGLIKSLKVFRILFNLQGNLYLAQQSMIDRWAIEILESPELLPKKLKSYAFVAAMIQTQWEMKSKANGAKATLNFEFRLRMVQSHQSDADVIIFSSNANSLKRD